MNKTELIEKLSKKTGLSLKESRLVVEKIFNTDPKEGIIVNELAAGRKVQITGFGSFVARKRKKRMGRNPQTGAPMLIKARRVVTFKTSEILKKNLNRPPI